MEQYIKSQMSKEELRQLLDLRRSSAASKHKNRKKYDRKKAKRELG
jgi:hypothetical protein